MTPGSSAGRPESADVREVRATLNRALRRLGILELILLGAAAIAALGGGWLAALLAAKAFELPFRATWIASSLAFFVIPALLALGIERFGRGAAKRKDRATGDRRSPQGDGG